MYTADSENTIAFDIDNTLIMWDKNYNSYFAGCVEVVCPWDGIPTFHRPHKRHIEFLKKQKIKGYTVLVWSSAGAKWAETVVKALNIEQYVDVVISKPIKWVDDLKDAAEVLGVRLYLDEKGFSK